MFHEKIDEFHLEDAMGEKFIRIISYFIRMAGRSNYPFMYVCRSEYLGNLFIKESEECFSKFNPFLKIKFYKGYHCSKCRKYYLKNVQEKCEKCSSDIILEELLYMFEVCKRSKISKLTCLKALRGDMLMYAGGILYLTFYISKKIYLKKEHFCFVCGSIIYPDKDKKSFHKHSSLTC